MTKEEIEKIIRKYQRKSQQYRKYTDEKCALFDRIAGQIELNKNDYLDDDYYETEEDVISNVREIFEENDNFFDAKEWEDFDWDDEDV